MIYDPIFWATWALGVTLHMFIYKNQAVGLTSAAIILILQIIAAVSAAVLSKEFGALAAVLVVFTSNTVTYLIIEQINRKRRGVIANECLVNLSRIAGK